MLMSALLALLLISLVVWRPALADAKKVSDTAVPMFIRQADKINVPANSPLRERLMVRAVSNAASQHMVTIPGAVEADPARTINIVPPLSGRLTQLKVRLGDVVKQGQVLAYIHSPDLLQAQSDAEKARDAKELAKRMLDRARGVNAIGANASKDLEQVESNYAQANAEYNRAEGRLKALGSHTSASTASADKTQGLSIVAPVSGTVIALNGGAGAYLNDTNAPLMTIADLDTVWVTANVPENLLAYVNKGQVAEMTMPAYPGQKLRGTISFVSAVLEPDTRRSKARIPVPNMNGKLKPNMFANVVISVPQAVQLSVPSSALLMNNDNVTVFVEVSPWTFVRRKVETGSEDGDIVKIIAGLNAGERVVVRGGVLLND
ncbi:efflux RND transporter periplasmic adaptor subunit [Undibacterium sp. SXout7W]|uniref:efflux RND transporter periplasmic adaptor subunit n=1 Tax=Undibacterium sp. SXout7W TaxID=3413049 RepID=UPI003BF03F2F